MENHSFDVTSRITSAIRKNKEFPRKPSRDHLLRADGVELPRAERLWEDFVFHQSEEVPLCASLGLEVPENPTSGGFFERIQLGLNVAARVVLQLLIPCIDEVDLVAGPYAWAPRIPAVIAGTNAITIQSCCAVGHRSRPLANNDPMIGISRVTAGMAANEVSVFLLMWSATNKEICNWIKGRLTVGDLATSSSENTCMRISG